MPVIRVDGEVWAWLKSQAEPFEDTPNSVLRRLAGLADRAPRGLRLAENEEDAMSERIIGKKTPQSDYRVPILLILLRHNGRADRTFVLKELERVLANSLTDYDRGDIKSGTVRWQKSAEWEVSTMRQEELLLPQSASPRGVWCLSPEGERMARDEFEKTRKKA